MRVYRFDNHGGLERSAQTRRTRPIAPARRIAAADNSGLAELPRHRDPVGPPPGPPRTRQQTRRGAVRKSHTPMG